jgi:hypothetical protein
MFLTCRSGCGHDEVYPRLGRGRRPLFSSFYCCRTLLAFWKSIKPAACNGTVEIIEKAQGLTATSARSLTIFSLISLVVVMSAVDRWKPWQLSCIVSDSTRLLVRRFVNIVESSFMQQKSVLLCGLFPTAIDRLSAHFPADFYSNFTPKRYSLRRWYINSHLDHARIKLTRKEMLFEDG